MSLFIVAPFNEVTTVPEMFFPLSHELIKSLLTFICHTGDLSVNTIKQTKQFNSYNKTHFTNILTAFHLFSETSLFFFIVSFYHVHTQCSILSQYRTFLPLPWHLCNFKRWIIRFYTIILCPSQMKTQM